MTDLSAGQVAKLLSVRRETIWRRVRAGKFPNARWTDGGHLRIPAEDVESLQKQREREGKCVTES